MKLSVEFKNVAKATSIAMPLLGATAYTVLNSGVHSVIPILVAAYIAKRYYPKISENSVLPNLDLERIVDRLAPEMGLRKPPKVYMSKMSLGSPAVTVNKNILVSPDYASFLPPAQKDWLLAHEMHHVKRKDGLVAVVYSSCVKASTGLAAMWTLNSVLDGVTHALTDSFPINYVINSSSNAAMTLLACSFYILMKKSVSNTIAENHEMEFDCDRAASMATGDIDSGIELLSMHKEFRQNWGPFMIIQGNPDWYSDSYIHPSGFSRVQALEDLRTDPAFQARPS